MPRVGRHAKLRVLRDGACLAAGLVLATTVASPQDATLLLTVFDERTGETATGLGAERFAVQDGSTELRVVSVREPRDPIDLLLLVDASIAGQEVRPVAEALVEELADHEAMAVVGYSEGAELLQDFTSDKQFLRRAMGRIEYGGLPRMLDGLFASLDGGFEGSLNRKVVVLLSNGAIAGSRVAETEVLELARAKRVSVYTVFVRNNARSYLRRVAFRTGGAPFAARRIKVPPRRLAELVLEAVRSPYELTVSGVYTLGDRIEASVHQASADRTKLSASVLAVD